MNTYSFDFETFYSKTYSVKDLGNWAYTRHPEFDAYMLTISGDNGYEYAGHPTKFDWQIFKPGDILGAHNAGFDTNVADALRELGKIDFKWAGITVYDTADLAAYLGYPRSLAQAALHMLGVKLDKGVRDRAKGQHWEDMTPEFQKQMREYALTDAKITLKLLLKYLKYWPQWERDVSRLTREMGNAGVPIDLSSLTTAISGLETKLWETRTLIPWATDDDAVVLSKKEAGLACRAAGVEPPASMAKDDPDFEKWLVKHGEKFPWAGAMTDYRSQNMLLKKLQTMKIRTREDGIMPYGMKYAGAHTLRDSGDQGLNVQNFSKKEMYGVDVRGMICAPEGKILGIVDLSAIEPCVLAWLSEDEEFLERLRNGEDPYEAWARIQHGYTDSRPLKEAAKTDPKYFWLRQLCKIEVLGLGYGAGVDKLMLMPGLLNIDIEMPRSQAEDSVKGFRGRGFIPALWSALETNMRNCAGEDYQMELPSGRSMRYREVTLLHGLQAVIPRLGKMLRCGFWGGTLTENMVQATSRDVFMHGVLKLAASGLPPIMRVHDEAVCLLDEATAEKDLETMQKGMSAVPEWIEGLPLRTEGFLSKKYKK